MIDEVRHKIKVLQKMAVAAYPDPMLIYLFGLLMGMVERVHFVRDLDGAPVAIQANVGRTRVWPSAPWHATIGGMAFPDPLTFASALAERSDPICVRLIFEGSEQDEDFQAVLMDGYADVATGRTPGVVKAEEQIDELKARIDRALDIYNETRRLMADGDPERRSELEAYQRMAKEELQACTRQLRALEMSVAERSEGQT